MWAIIYIGVGTGLLFGLAVYFAWRNNRKAALLTQKLTESEAALTTLHASEKRLRNDVSLLQNKLNHTFQDPVTGLLGWQLFEDRLQQSVKESARYQLNLGVLYIDINNFKMINDALSYEVGDALLKEAGERLQTCIRQVDSLSRFGKDNFVMLLAQLSKPETAAVVAQRILHVFSEPFQIKNHELYVTLCIGIAIYPSDGEDAASLLRSADHALHLAKEKGKNIYQFYQERMHTKSQRELALYTGLSRDNICEELVLYYQPIMNVTNETLVCMDALLYWQHPEMGLIKPDELAELAEKQRKMHVIAAWMLKSACKQFLKWRNMGFEVALLGIPVTLKQLEDSHFVYSISQILQEVDFKPEWLVIEIKETTPQLSMDGIEKAFNMLNYLGVKIAIDHFGEGPFCFYHLKHFKTDYLKLGQALIEDIDHNPQTVKVIASIVALTKSLGVQLIAQGVESDIQSRMLVELGCTLMQGPLLGEPLLGQEVTSKMIVTS